MKRKREWRMWVIACDGVGPIQDRMYASRGGALIGKKYNYPDNDLYQVLRVKVVADPPKRAKRKTSEEATRE